MPGVSRQHHYDIKSAVEEDGVEGLIEKSRKVPRIGNRVAPEIEQRVLDYALEFPTLARTPVISDTLTKVRHPQTNGSVERLNQIVQNEFYKVAFRKKIYKSIEEIQADLDIFMDDYNNVRTNQGKHCQGRTPRHTFHDGRTLYQQYVFENSEEENQAA